MTRSENRRVNYNRLDTDLQQETVQQRVHNHPIQNPNSDLKEADSEECRPIQLILMDPAQNKFDIVAYSSWSVARLKQEGVAIHKVTPSQQRLIFMGHLLCDETILLDAKINKDGLIIHLFPKPRIILQRANDDTGGHGTEHLDATDNPGAHVSQVILGPEEAEMRSQILVLGSVEYMDASNNVKLLSFFLLIMTSMELLALFTILVGVPPSDMDASSGDDTTDADTRTWRNSDYFDLLLNMFGFYVAMLGMKATSEHSRLLAFRYLICTLVCGILWNGFYYYLNFRVEKKTDLDRHTNNETTEPMLTTIDLLEKSFLAILLPMLIWIVCCLRAVQFHGLLREAEREAEERIQSEIQMIDDDSDSDDNNTV
jgi:Ubiquitin family